MKKHLKMNERLQEWQKKAQNGDFINLLLPKFNHP